MGLHDRGDWDSKSLARDLVSIPTVMARSKSGSASGACTPGDAAQWAAGDSQAELAIIWKALRRSAMRSLRTPSRLAAAWSMVTPFASRLLSETVTDVAVELSALRISHHRRGCVKVSGRAVVPEES